MNRQLQAGAADILEHDKGSKFQFLDIEPQIAQVLNWGDLGYHLAVSRDIGGCLYWGQRREHVLQKI